jgi:hypothetical protein
MNCRIQSLWDLSLDALSTTVCSSIAQPVWKRLYGYGITATKAGNAMVVLRQRTGRAVNERSIKKMRINNQMAAKRKARPLPKLVSLSGGPKCGEKVPPLVSRLTVPIIIDGFIIGYHVYELIHVVEMNKVGYFYLGIVSKEGFPV